MEKRRLIKEDSDSTLRFTYFIEPSVGEKREEKYIFKIINQDLFLLNDSTLQLIDTFNIKVGEDKFKLFRYEIIHPADEGDGGYIFTKEYGLIGIGAYGILN